MITDKRLRKLFEPRIHVLEHVKNLKNANPDLKVIDVGGGICCWCPETTHVADIFIVPGSKEQLKIDRPDVTVYDLDINQSENWHEILRYVEENGKFDYSICTHTLEDIPYANVVCEMLMKISKAGVIAVPSKYAEYLRFEKQYAISGYRGFFHHKWIYSMKNNVFTGYEKNNYWEMVNSYKLNKPDGLFTEICFMWENDFEYKFYHLGEVLGADGHSPKYVEISKDDDLVL